MLVVHNGRIIIGYPPLFVEPARGEDISDRQIAWCCMIFCFILFFFIFIVINDSLWHSYAESSCFVVNSTVVQRQSCSHCQNKPVFDAIWTVDVHPARYLADIRQQFDIYYEAYEAISTLHLVSINSD